MLELVDEHDGNPGKLTEALESLVERRMSSIRVAASSAVNEQRRRAAVRAGIDPRTITYSTASVINE